MVLSRPEHSLYVALGGIGQEWIRTTEGMSQRIYSPHFYSVIDLLGKKWETYTQNEG